MELHDDVISIYDETRRKNYAKTDNRFYGLPDEKNKIDSRGNAVYSSDDSQESEIEVVSPAITRQSTDEGVSTSRNSSKV